MENRPTQWKTTWKRGAGTRMTNSLMNLTQRTNRKPILEFGPKASQGKTASGVCRRECDDLDSRFLGCRDGSLPERHLTRNLARNLTRQEASRELRAISKRSEKSTWRKRNWDSTETVVGWKSDGSQLSMNGTEAEDGQWVWFPGTVIVSRCPYGCVRSVHQK